MAETRLEIVRLPYMIAYAEASPFKDTYGGDVGHVFVEAMLIRPRDLASKTVVVFSHPIGGGSFLPIMTALAARGHHVLYVNTRYRGNDSALIVEHCVRDLGAAISDARTRFGYERILLGGWSGGGSLALFYQEQAERPTVTTTPAGDPADLVGAGLVPGEGIVLVAAHVGRSVTLTEWIDASVVDEAHPERRAPGLDLYDPANPAQPPYRPEFVARYRAAQVARNERITHFAEGMLDELRRSGRPNAEHCFVVHRTMADPRWLDPSIDPNGRKPRWCYLGDPETVNDGPVGLARFTTLRSWLSQWSLRASRAHGERNAANTSIPTLVVGNGADDACTPSHTRRLFEAIPHRRKSMYEIEGASHYYVGQRTELAACIGHYERWLEEHGFMERAR